MSNRNTRGAVVSYNKYTCFYILKNHFVRFLKRSRDPVTSNISKKWLIVNSYHNTILSHLYLTAELQWKLKDIPEVKSPCFFLHLFVSVFIFCVLCSSFLPMSMNRWKKKKELCRLKNPPWTIMPTSLNEKHVHIFNAKLYKLHSHTIHY